MDNDVFMMKTQRAGARCELHAHSYTGHFALRHFLLSL